MGRRICLITPGHLASTPRAVREAEALSAAGYDVHLVASNHFPPVEPLDQAVLARATWQTTRVCAYAGAGAMLNRLRRRWLRRFRPAPEQLTLAQANLLLHPGMGRLVDAAAATGADFFHAHGVAGLAVAAQAATRRGVGYGFDAEDFHEAETVEVERDAFERAIVRRVMEAHLRGARLLTAAAPLIAAEFERVHGVKMTVVLNTFPLRDSPTKPVPLRVISAAEPARLYWFSQTIGPGRGIERMLAVMARMRTPVRLQLRGGAAASYANHLRTVAERAGLTDAVELLPSASPDEMVRLAAGADLGLSLEEKQPRNRDLCLTNKVFVYLLAGIPQVLSRTTAQTAFAPELENAGFLADFDQPDATARQLDDFFQDEGQARAARATAWRLGHERYCWEMERATLLEPFHSLLK